MKLVYLGSGDIGLPTLRALAARHEVAAVVTQPDQPAGRGLTVREPAIKQLARELNLRVLQPERVRRPEAVEDLRGFAAEVFVVFAYGQILPQAVLDLPRLAALNIHASLLPRWRGAAPIQAAIRAGDPHTGHTIMFMDAGLDTGDILLQREIPIGPEQTGGELHDQLAELAPECILDALEKLATGHPPRMPQDNSAATHAPKLTRESGHVDWNKPAEEIARTIRAFNPWPGSFTALPDGRLLKIFRAVVRPESGEAGTILRADAGEFVVAAGEGSIALGEVQLEGRRRVAARDFLNGQSVKPGERLT